jgi:hypothetical protein
MMQQRTTWTRLEPRPRSDDMDDGLRAAVRDPLWLLSRQWQVNEFRGTDGGSAVRADLEIEEDRLTMIDHRAGGRGDVDPFAYPGDPLEATIEREHVTDDPPLRLRAEAGQQFLRLLERRGVGEFTPEEFDERLRLSAPEGGLEAPDRRYVDVMAGRTLDGTAVARSIRRAVGNIEEVVESGSDWEDVKESELPLPNEADRSAKLEGCVESYYGWYVGLYDEPTEKSGGAWDPERLEYSFAVSTGDQETETVFEASEYRGDRLDWYSVSPTDGESLDPPSDGATEGRSEAIVPTRISVPGMPAPQWWEFEQADVDLTDVTEDGAALSRLLLVEFALQFGNDWFRIPLQTGVGTLSRIPELTITDSFGIVETATPVLEDDWHLFMHELPGHEEPGLLMLPTAGERRQSDPVEQVVFSRDNTANLVFALERRVEGPTGRSIDRTEFREPRLVVDAATANTDPDAEYLRLANPGEDRYVLDGYRIDAGRSDGSSETVCSIDEQTLAAGGTLEVYTGEASENDAIGCNRLESVWTDADSVEIRNDEGRLILRKSLSGPAPARADYRLSTSVPPYWFPFVPVRSTDGDDAASLRDPFTAESDEFRLERALLLDADSLGLPLEEIPRPNGEILRPDPDLLPDEAETYRILDEEVPLGGREVIRQYRFARGIDGRGYLWSGRHSRIGDTQLESGLRFDILEDRSDVGLHNNEREFSPSGSADEVREFGEAIEAEEVEGVHDVDEINEVDLAIDLNVAGVPLEDEHVVLRNTGDEPIDFTGWQLMDRLDGGVVDTPIDDAYVFPNGFVLDPDEEVTVWTADGKDTMADLHWGLGTHLWRAEGDVVRIFDDRDDLVFEYAYGDWS